MIGNHAVCRRIIAAGRPTGELNRSANDPLKEVYLVIAVNPLQHSRHPLQPHASVNRRLWQIYPIAIGQLLILHENEIPDFDEPVPVFIWRTRRTTRNARTMVIEYLRTRTTWSCIAHRPEIITGCDTNNSLLGQTGNPRP